MLLLLLLPLCFIIPGDGLVLPEEEDLLNMLLPAGHNNGPDAKILPKDMDVGVNKMDEIYRVMVNLCKLILFTLQTLLVYMA